MPTTPFLTVLNNVSTTLALPYTAGSGPRTFSLRGGAVASINVEIDAENLPAVDTDHPLLLTIAVSDTIATVYAITSMTASVSVVLLAGTVVVDQVTGTLEEGTDRDYPIGAFAQPRLPAGQWRKATAAINAIEATGISAPPTGLLKGVSGALTTATPNTDYLPPAGNASAVTATATRPHESTRTLAARLADSINIKDFLAVGDAVFSNGAWTGTDNTAFITNALAVATGEAICPPGAYITGPFTVPAGVRMSGKGVTFVLKSGVVVSGSGTEMITLETGAVLDGLTLDGNAPGNPGPAGFSSGLVRIDNAPHATVTRCTLQNHPGSGVFIYESADVSVVSNRFANLGFEVTNASSAVYAQYLSHKTIVDDNRISGCFGSGIKLDAGDTGHPDTVTDGPIVTNNRIDYRGVTLTVPTGLAIEVWSFTAGDPGFIGGAVDGNQVWGPDGGGTDTLFGISLGGCTDVGVSGNTVIGAKINIGIEFANVIRPRAVNNSITNAMIGFSVSGITPCPSITGNTLTGCGMGVQLYGANVADALLSSNTFLDCGARAVYLNNGGSGSLIIGNKFLVQNNTSSSDEGYPAGAMKAIYAFGSVSDLTVRGNHCRPVAGGSSAGGCALFEGSGAVVRMTIDGNTMDGASPSAGTAAVSHGILIYNGDSGDHLIRGNTIKNASATGIYQDATSSAGWYVTNNKLVNTGSALSLNRVTPDTIRYGNTIDGATIATEPNVAAKFSALTIGSGSGLAKLTSGVVSTATAGTDYLVPSGSGAALTGITQGQISGLTAALAAKAALASPTFTGTPAAPTPSTADNSTLLATTAYVKSQGYLIPSGSGAALTGVVYTAGGSVMAGQLSFANNRYLVFQNTAAADSVFVYVNSSNAWVLQNSILNGLTSFTLYGTGGLFTVAVQSGSDLFRVGYTATTFLVPPVLPSYTVATLPASPVAYTEAYVTDATTPAWNATVVGGGAVKVGVWFDGSAWKVR